MNRHIIPASEALAMNRRAFLYRLGYGLGGLAFTALLAQERARAGVLAAKAQMISCRTDGGTTTRFVAFLRYS